MTKTIRNTPRPLTWVREGECIRCTSHKLSARGYPVMRREGKVSKIARWVLIKRHGSIPKEKVSRHTCDNTWCIRPDHIVIGTQADNVRDMVDRGRCSSKSGEDHPNSKLTDIQVLQIRESAEVARKIAPKFGISISAVHMIRRREIWAHL